MGEDNDGEGGEDSYGGEGEDSHCHTSVSTGWSGSLEVVGLYLEPSVSRGLGSFWTHRPPWLVIWTL